jgi:hypothetical protein
MIFLVNIGLAIWYLARPEPLIVQGEVEGTSIDIAAPAGKCELLAAEQALYNCHRLGQPLDSDAANIEAQPRLPYSDFMAPAPSPS